MHFQGKKEGGTDGGPNGFQLGGPNRISNGVQMRFVMGSKGGGGVQMRVQMGFKWASGWVGLSPDGPQRWVQMEIQMVMSCNVMF